MSIALFLFKLFLKFVYIFIKLFPVKNKITMISRQSNDIPLNFKLLNDGLKKETSYETVILCKKIEKGLKNKIKYFLHMFCQMYHIATSKVVILDSYCIVISNLKHKKGLKVIQMWHAMGSLKKFGYSAIGKNEGKSKKISKLLNMHKNYDYILTSSSFCKNNFKEAFNAKDKNMVIMPLPIVDFISDKKNRKNIEKNIFAKYKNLKDKKNILYCPTFRKNEDEKKIYDLIKIIDFDKYNLIIKLHPLSKVHINSDKVIIDDSFSTVEMAFISDYIITDYSAVVFEVCLLNKPMYFYTYDYKEYVNNRDFYIDYVSEMPGFISDDPSQIYSRINNNDYNIKNIKSFSKKYITIPKDGVVSNLIKLINKKD